MLLIYELASVNLWSSLTETKDFVNMQNFWPLFALQ